MINGGLNPAQVAAVNSRLDRAYAKAQAAADAGVRANTLKLAAYVQTQKLSGQSLNVRTGLLRRSLQPPVFEQGSGITTGIIGRTLPQYGKMFEAGFTGDVRVKAHQRMQSKAWGKPMKDPRQVAVASFSRHVDVKPREFLKLSLNENREGIVEDIRRRVLESMQ